MQRAHRFGLVELSVADEAPHLRVLRVGDAPVVEIAIEPRLVDRVDRAETHRHGREFPERWQPTRMRIRRQAATTGLAPEVVELVLGEPALEERSRVDARRGVTLEVDLVAVPAVALAAEEVV